MHSVAVAFSPVQKVGQEEVASLFNLIMNRHSGSGRVEIRVKSEDFTRMMFMNNVLPPGASLSVMSPGEYAGTGSEKILARNAALLAGSAALFAVSSNPASSVSALRVLIGPAAEQGVPVVEIRPSALSLEASQGGLFAAENSEAAPAHAAQDVRFAMANDIQSARDFMFTAGPTKSLSEIDYTQGLPVQIVDGRIVIVPEEFLSMSGHLDAEQTAVLEDTRAKLLEEEADSGGTQEGSDALSRLEKALGIDQPAVAFSASPFFAEPTPGRAGGNLLDPSNEDRPIQPKGAATRNRGVSAETAIADLARRIGTIVRSTVAENKNTRVYAITSLSSDGFLAKLTEGAQDVLPDALEVLFGRISDAIREIDDDFGKATLTTDSLEARLEWAQSVGALESGAGNLEYSLEGLLNKDKGTLAMAAFTDWQIKDYLAAGHLERLSAPVINQANEYADLVEQSLRKAWDALERSSPPVTPGQYAGEKILRVSLMAQTALLEAQKQPRPQFSKDLVAALSQHKPALQEAINDAWSDLEDRYTVLSEQGSREYIRRLGALLDKTQAVFSDWERALVGSEGIFSGNNPTLQYAVNRFPDSAAFLASNALHVIKVQIEDLSGITYENTKECFSLQDDMGATPKTVAQSPCPPVSSPSVAAPPVEASLSPERRQALIDELLKLSMNEVTKLVDEMTSILQDGAHLVTRFEPVGIGSLGNGLAPDNLAIGVIADTETTSLLYNRKVIEVGLVKFSYDPRTGIPYEVLDTYSGLQDPKEPLSPIVTKVTGLTDAQLAGQSLDLQRISRIFSGAQIVIAHNADFDRRHYAELCPATNAIPWACSMSEIDWGHDGEAVSSKTLDHLMRVVRHKTFSGHRAINDCEATLDMLQGASKITGVPFLKHLLDASTVDRVTLFVGANAIPFETSLAMGSRLGYGFCYGKKEEGDRYPKGRVSECLGAQKAWEKLVETWNTFRVVPEIFLTSAHQKFLPAAPYQKTQFRDFFSRERFDWGQLEELPRYLKATAQPKVLTANPLSP